MKRSFWVSAFLFLFTAVVLSDVGGAGLQADLVTEGVPPIPTALSDEVSRYSSFPEAEFMGWHPLRREMLVRTYGYGARHRGQIHRVDRPGGWLQQITFFSDPVALVSYHRPKGDYLVLDKDSDGNERYQMYRYDCTTGDVTLLTDGRTRNTSWTWLPSHRHIVYLSTRPHSRDLDLYRMAPSHPQSRRLLALLGGEKWSIRSGSPDGERIVLGEYLSDRESRLWLLDMASGRRKLLTPPDPSEPAAYASAAFRPDGRGIYLLTNRQSEFWQLAYLDQATGRIVPLMHRRRWDVSSFRMTRDGKTIAFVTNEDGASLLHLLDTATGKERPVPMHPPGVILNYGWNSRGSELGFTFESAHLPPDAYSLDVRSNRLQRWTHSRGAGVDVAESVRTERIHWRSFDGREISGILYRPQEGFTGRRPVIIDIHGGPESQAMMGYIGAWNYYVSTLGIAFIRPNIRGSAGYGKTFLDLDNGFRREDACRDIGALLDWIRRRPDLDAGRVMVRGGSYGGYMALAVAAAYSDRIRCAVDEYGPSNLITFLASGTAASDLRRAEYGDERNPRVRAYLERIAPLNNARKIIKPLFIAQGAEDPRVPMGESQQMVDAVRRNGTPVWYVLAWHEGHGFFKPTNISYLIDAEALFVKEYLLH